MKARTLILAALAGGISIAMLPQAALAIGGTIGPKGNPCAIKDMEDRQKRMLKCPPYDKAPRPTTGGAQSSGGQASGPTTGPQSGSSEHSSVRGTINGGGDFIAPKLKEKPRGVAPRPKSR